MKVALRQYQLEALDRIDEAEARGVRRQLLVAATGLGKTVMFCGLAERRKARTLIIAHRDELIEQAAAKVREVWPETSVGVVKAERDDVHAHVVVASIQTLARGHRLDRLIASTESILRPCDPFDLLVVDEAHHAAADTYRRVLDRFGTGPLVLGVTATPDRGDGKGLDDLFDEIVAAYDIRWGIRSGYLSDLRGIQVRVDFDLGAVKVRRGDYDQGQAGTMMEAAGAPEHIVDAWCQHAKGRRTLVFTPTVHMAVLVADAFAVEGVRAGMVSGDTPMDQRRALLGAYSRGDLDVMVNCAVLTEGYDEPRTDCIVVARPTQSRALYTQMIGRGTRRHPDKTDCLVLDVVGASSIHSLVTIPSLFGLDDQRAEQIDVRGVASLADEQDHEQVRLGILRAEEVDLFAAMRRQGMAWVATHREGERRRYEITVGGHRGLTVVLQQLGADDHYVVGLIHPIGPGDVKRRKETLMIHVPLELAQGVGEDYLRKNGYGDSTLLKADAAWRAGKPSARQRALAKRLGITVTKGMTCGEVSDLISVGLSRKQRRQL